MTEITAKMYWQFAHNQNATIWRNVIYMFWYPRINLGFSVCVVPNSVGVRAVQWRIRTHFRVTFTPWVQSCCFCSLPCPYCCSQAMFVSLMQGHSAHTPCSILDNSDTRTAIRLLQFFRVTLLTQNKAMRSSECTY